MVRKISGKSKSASYKHLNTNFNNTEAKDLADTLGSTFMKNSSNRNYCEKFQTYMYDQQKFNFNFKSSNTEEYNNIKSEMRSFKSNENIHKKEGGSYYVVSANKASSVTL